VCRIRISDPKSTVKHPYPLFRRVPPGFLVSFFISRLQVVTALSGLIYIPFSKVTALDSCPRPCLNPLPRPRLDLFPENKTK